MVAKRVCLIRPKLYDTISEEERFRICNGCGASGQVDYVPDRIWGLPITEVCNVHDFMYYLGDSWRDKEEADKIFLINMLRVIDEAPRKGLLQRILRKLRKIRALSYYNAVRHFGGLAFWADKTYINYKGDSKMSLFTLTAEELEAVEKEEERKVYPADQDVMLRITKLLPNDEDELVRSNKRGEPYLMVQMKICEVQGAEDYKPVTHYLALPSSEIEDPETKKSVRLKYKKFMTAFDIPLEDEVTENSLIGKKAPAILDIEEDAQYGNKNVIKRFV